MSLTTKRQNYRKNIRKNQIQSIFLKQREKLIKYNRSIPQNQSLLQAINLQKIQTISSLASHASVDTVVIFQKHYQKIFKIALQNIQSENGAFVFFLLTFFAIDKLEKLLISNSIIHKLISLLQFNYPLTQQPIHKQKLYLGALRNVLNKNQNQQLLHYLLKNHLKNWYKKYSQQANFILILAKISECCKVENIQFLIQKAQILIISKQTEHNNKQKQRQKQRILLAYSTIIINFIYLSNPMSYQAHYPALINLLIQFYENSKQYQIIKQHSLNGIGKIISEMRGQVFQSEQMIKLFCVRLMPFFRIILQSGSVANKQLCLLVMKKVIERSYLNLGQNTQYVRKEQIMKQIYDQHTIYRMIQILQQMRVGGILTALQIVSILVQSNKRYIMVSLADGQRLNSIEEMCYHNDSQVSERCVAIKQILEDFMKKLNQEQQQMIDQK